MDQPRREQVQQKLRRLESTLPRRGRLLILPHDYPDPDALAAAAALHLLLARRFHRNSLIVFSGAVSRAENRELLRYFRYTWRLLDQLDAPSQRAACLTVDTTPWSGNLTLPAFARPIAVFDHHAPPRPRQRRQTLELYEEVRPGTGATTSLLYEYLSAADVSPPRWLASIMAYAIAAETLDLSRNVTALDLEAYVALLKLANMSVMGAIRHAPLPRAYYGQLEEAMRNARVYGRVVWTHLGTVTQPEIVAEIADLLLRLERINWAFCTSWQGDRLIFSLRSTQRGAHCGRLLRALVRRNGSAGGHDEMAAGYLNAAGWSAEERETHRLAFVRALVSRVEHRGLPRSSADELPAHPLT